MYNDDMSSIMVPFGITIELYENDSWTGDSRTYEGEMFTEFNQRMRCINLDSDSFNDKTSSLIVYRSRIFGAAVGKWMPVMSTSYEISALVHYGIKTRQASALNEQYVITYEMRDGVTFETTPIANTVLSEIQDDARSFYSYDSKTSYQVKCDPKDADGVGLYQWVVESADGKSKVATNHTVCRYGASLYN